MNRVQRIAAIVAELRVRKLAAAAVPLTVAELEGAGFKVHPFPDGAGLAVDKAPGLAAKLDELEARGIRPALIVIIRKIEDEEHASGPRQTAKASGGRGRSGGSTPGAQPPTIPATPSTRVTDPTTRRNDGRH